MRLILAAVGRLKDSGERELFERYRQRLDASGRSLALGPLKLVELPEARQSTVDQRRQDEASRLIKAASDADVRVALDEHGKSLTSEAFASWLRSRRDSGASSVAFLIGGPDGHGRDILENADLKLSLGPMTLPHGLARVVLAEQLYRAATIIAGHPYHRS